MVYLLNDKLKRALNGEAIDEEDNEDHNVFCSNCNLLRKEKQLLEDKVQSLLDSIRSLSKTKQRDELFTILNNLFLEEYKDLYYRIDPKERDENLEQIFIDQQILFSSMNLDVSSYDEATYRKIIDILLKFDLSYDNFFKYYQKIKDEDRPEYKLRIAQSIIRVAFSKEK